VVLIICSLAIAMATQSINVAPGEEFTVTRTSAPSTGYVWEVRALPDSIELMGSAYEKPAGDGGRPGDPAVQVFRFRALKSGDYHITFSLRRKWEKEAIESETVDVHIR
jgi:predicted secreted protein